MAEVSCAGDDDTQHLLDNKQLANLLVTMDEILRNTVLFEVGLKNKKCNINVRNSRFHNKKTWHCGDQYYVPPI